MPKDPTLATRAATPEVHRGYQTWHRQLDSTVVEWVEVNAKASVDEFEAFLRSLYNSPTMRARFPEGLP